MHGIENWLSLSAEISNFGWPPPLLGYMGLGQGPELIPYFAALMSFIGAAIIAVLQWPLSVLFGRFSRARRRATSQEEAAQRSHAESDATPEHAQST